MKEEFFKKTHKAISNEKLSEASGGNATGKFKRLRNFGKLGKFTEKETQEEWIDLMGIPNKK